MTRPGVELEWTVDEEEGEWTGSRVPPPDHRRPRRRIVLLVGLTLVALTVTVSLVLRHRIAQNQRRLRADIQALIDLETRAVANDDLELFLSLQSKEHVAWLEAQKITFDYYAQNLLEWPHLEVTRVELVDDYAWAHTTGRSSETGEALEWVLFFQLQDGIWRPAPPDLRYWGTEQERNIGPLHFFYHERDESSIHTIAQRVTELLGLLCEDLGCPADTSLQVQLVLPPPHGSAQVTDPTTLVIHSPAAVPPPLLPPQLGLVSRVGYTVAPYLAFEAAGGEKRWERNRDGALLVGAAANWAAERLWKQSYGADLDSPFESVREFLRMVVRNGRVPPLDDVWHEQRVRTVSYPALIQVYARPTTLPGAHAMTVIEYIIGRYGTEAIPDLLSAIARNDTLDGVLRDALGIGLDEFESDWWNWLAARYGGASSERSTD